MKLLQNLPIKYKIVLIILCITLLVVGLGFSIGMLHYKRTLKSDLIRNLEVNAKLIGEYCVTPLAFNDSPGAERVMSKLQAIPMVIHGRVYNDKGELFAAYESTGVKSEPPFPIEKRKPVFMDGHLHLIHPIEYEKIFYGYIYIAGTLEPLNQKIHAANTFMATLMLALIVLTLLLAFSWQKHISQPILDLARVTQYISDNADFSIRVAKKGSDEFGILYDGFNSMLKQLHHREMERDRAEGEIKASLREKEVMLKEIHHRVKNNLQIISSLLSLQSSHVRDESALAMFVDCQNRVRSMALVHEKLYHSPDLASINFSDYVETLITGLQTSYHSDNRHITFDIDIMDVALSIDQAVPCGLLIHELVSNSLKHAFNSHGEGLIQVKFRKNEENEKFRLSVRDNGQGIPEDVDYRKTDSLGLRLAVVLAEKQLCGTITLDRSSGTAFYVQF